MKQVIARPPNYDAIVRVFPFAARETVIFTYGDTIYNPSGVTIEGPLKAHEAVHSQRQLAEGMDPEKWWWEYLYRPHFRLEEERLAHRAEYGAYKSHERNARRREQMLHHIAAKLASPLYGEMLTPDAARRLLR